MNHADFVLGAADARDIGLENGLVLASIQVAPLLAALVVAWGFLVAMRAGQRCTGRNINLYRNPVVIGGQLNISHLPGRGNT